MMGKTGIFTRLASGPARRASGERGAGTVEYIALLIIMGFSLGVTATIGGVGGQAQGALVKTVQYGVCKAMTTAVGKLGVRVDGGCERFHELPSNLPLCTTYQQDRLLSGNVDFRFIHGEVTGKDQIIDMIDPATGKETAYVILSNEAGVGLEADTGDKVPTGNLSKFLSNKGFSAGAKATLTAGSGVVYKFDSAKDAQDFLNQRRGNTFTRVLGVVTGGKADALFDGIRKGWNWLTGHKDTGPTPSGLTLDLGLQAEGNVSFQGGSVPGTKGTAGFTADVKANGKESGQLRYNFDGSSQLSVRWQGEVGGSAGVGVSKDLQKKYPLLQDFGLSGNGNLNGAVGYTIKFDKHGKPTTFVLQTETGDSIGGKIGGKSFGKKGNVGDLTVHTYTLDLSDPNNRDAVMNTLPWVMAGNLASPSVPVGILATDNPLSRRLKQNSVEYEQNYSTTGDQMAASTPDSDRENGVKVKGFGVGYNDETARRTLKHARYIDHSQPGATWQDLAKCKKK